MSFIPKLLGGGLLGLALGGLFGKKKKPDIIQPRSVTRDDAAGEAARDQELARRRGAAADRSAGAGASMGGGAGIGSFVVGS